MLRIIKIIEDTMVDGPGLRTSIYCSGCLHRCKGCHNPQSWDFNAGQSMSVEQVMEIIEKNPFDDVTFTGGDPMYQAKDFTLLARQIKQQTNKTIWCYTGFSFEEVKNDKDMYNLLQYIDVLVDGEFHEQEKDLSLLFKGSRNQRTIDVKRSLKENKTVLYCNEQPQ